MSVKERIALLLAIKEEGKKVEFEHILEKVGRDVKFVESRELTIEELKRNLEELEKEGYVRRIQQYYQPTERIDEYVNSFITEKAKILNRSYILVWKAKHYYPVAGPLMLPYLKGRPVSVVKIFSGKTNPIEEIDPIFVRYSRYKPKPQHILIDSIEKLMEYVHDHCIDFIPYVHKLGEDKPDIFILDLDAGKKIIERKQGFEFLKFVTVKLYEILEENDVKAMIKFSGSRGFQIWAKLDNSRIKSEDVFATYRGIAVRIQSLLERELRKEEEKIKQRFPEFKDLSEYTTAQVAHKEEREDKILIDWSAMKPQGDVRAPFSIHYKTGLVSIPLDKEEVDGFEPNLAEPFNVIKMISQGKRFPEIEVSDPSKLLNKINMLNCG